MKNLTVHRKRIGNGDHSMRIRIIYPCYHNGLRILLKNDNGYIHMILSPEYEFPWIILQAIASYANVPKGYTIDDMSKHLLDNPTYVPVRVKNHNVDIMV